MEQRFDEIEKHLVEIKKDLSYHIKRTDELEELTLPIYKAYIFFNYLVKALGPIAVGLGIYFKLS